MDHTHEHGESCGCGGHHHEHREGCGCGHHHRCQAEGVKLPLSGAEADMLSMIGQFRYLPVARFVLTSSQDGELWSSALEPVTINELADSMEDVKQRGAVLRSLEEKGLITLDYDIPIRGYDYQGYREAELYKYFQATVDESKCNPGFRFDTAELDEGSMALTELGERALGIQE